MLKTLLLALDAYADGTEYVVEGTTRNHDDRIRRPAAPEVPLISLFLESVFSVLIVRVSHLQKEDRKEKRKRLRSSQLFGTPRRSAPILIMECRSRSRSS